MIIVVFCDTYRASKLCVHFISNAMGYVPFRNRNLILQHPKALLVSGDSESLSVPRLLSPFFI